jgi:hypothetical protein
MHSGIKLNKPTRIFFTKKFICLQFFLLSNYNLVLEFLDFFDFLNFYDFIDF